jgi:DNA polymerase phi
MPSKQTVILDSLAAGLQQEATHFKIRVLDFVDTFIKERSESPHTPRTVVPLVRTIMGSGPDEKQLAEKTIGILKTRFHTPKSLPCLEPDSKGEMLDIKRLTNDFEQLHRIARKASLSQEGLSEIITTCTIYLAKVLAHAGMQEIVTATYVTSIGDFVTRKNSRIWTAFITDFARRSSPLLSWPLRNEILKACSVGGTVNTYRQMTSFQVLGVFLSSVGQLVCFISSRAFVH